MQRYKNECDNLTIDMLNDYCNKFKEDMRNIGSNLTVYDIPCRKSKPKII